MNGVTLGTFKETLKKFQEALLYIGKKQNELKSDPERYKKIKRNFKTKFEEPLDKAWEGLSATDKNKVPFYYLEKEAMKDPKVKEVVDFFDGKVVDVKYGKEVSKC